LPGTIEKMWNNTVDEYARWNYCPHPDRIYQKKGSEWKVWNRSQTTGSTRRSTRKYRKYLLTQELPDHLRPVTVERIGSTVLNILSRGKYYDAAETNRDQERLGWIHLEMYTSDEQENQYADAI